MFIAEEKLQSNVAEYVIYMFQIEDLIRAYNFDIESIRQNIIRPQVKSDAFEEEAVKWYEDIVTEMKSRKLQTKEHLFRVNEIITELIYLHNTLKDVVKDPKYIGLIEHAEGHVEAFRNKSDLKDNHLVDICFQALYMKMLLRLQKKEISQESEVAFDSMRIVLAYLSKAYHQMKSGDMSMFEPHQ